MSRISPYGLRKHALANVVHPLRKDGSHVNLAVMALWMTFESEKSKSEKLRKIAEGYTESLNFLAEQPVYDHDLGFLVINSFLKGYEATGNEQYKQIALAAADTLATLFNDKVGTILSWPRHVKDYGGHNTIMDNMINLELLFWAAEHGGDKHLADIAVRHAETTMNHHFRPDGSCYHVAVYDTLTGDFIKGVTHQDYADSSMWASSCIPQVTILPAAR